MPAQITRLPIGRIIRDARVKARLTQRQLADRLDVKQQTVSNWESGARMPDSDAFFRILAACEASRATYTRLHQLADNVHSAPRNESYVNQTMDPPIGPRPLVSIPRAA